MRKILIHIIILFFISVATYAQTSISDNIYGGSEGGIVGKISDRYEVTPNGQLCYEMPIEVVAGTGGVIPHLSMSYNSANTTGLLGHGFDLNGLSMISRAPKNLFRDGKADVVRLNSSDRFALDGMRLSLVRTTSSTREYKTEMNNFAKIIAEGDVVNPSRFIVYTKSGIRHEYLPAKALMGSTGDNLYWLETKTIDTKGNYYTVTYTGEPNLNEYLPMRIDYTGNQAKGLAPYASVRFSYQSVNFTTSYVCGQKVCHGHVVKRISCFRNDSEVKRYDIDYSRINGRAFVKQVTETSGNEHKNPTLFTWNTGGTIGVRHAIASQDASFKDKKIVTGDFNGDGMADFLARANDDSQDLNYAIYLSNGNSFAKSVSGAFLLPTYPDKKRIEEVQSGDFNGDGYDDIALLRGNSPFYVLDLYLAKAAPNGNVSLEYSKAVIPSIYFDHTMTVMDANSDGAADLFFREANYAGEHYYTLLSKYTGTGIQPLATQYDGNLTNDSWMGSVPLVDIDGDGTCEVLNVHDTGNSTLYLMQPNGELSLEKGFTISQTDYFSIGNFNGDGKTDILTTGSTKDSSVGWEMNVSTGLTKDGENSFNFFSIDNYFSSKEKQIFVVDVNGDGYDDLYAVDRKTVNGTKKPIDIYLNNCSTQAFYHYTGASVYGTDKRMYKFADFNGDGKTDFICYAKYGDHTSGYNLYLADDSSTNLLTSITDGLGCTTAIEYKRLTDNSIHTRGLRTTYPVVSSTCAWPVVSSITSPDGIGGKRSISYKYGNMLMHKRGRGMLCFEKITSTDNATGEMTESRYEVIDEEMVPAIKGAKTYMGNRLTGDVEYTNTLSYQLHTNNAEVSFSCMPTKTVQRNYEYNTCQLTSETVTTAEYDKYGNATNTVTECGGNTTTTVNTYSNNEESWILGRLTKTIVSKSNALGSSQLSSGFDYDPESGLLTKEMYDLGNIEGYTKTYSYDAYGNVVEDVMSANDSRYDPRKTRTEYSADGRFKVKSINALGFTSLYTTDNSLGVMTATTDINGLVSTITHNSFGQVTCVATPLTTTRTVTAWSAGHEYAPANALYYVKTESTGQPTQWEFFDCLGRSLRKVTAGRGQKMIFADAIYNSKGQLVQQSLPYYRGDNPHWNNMQYDTAGRLEKSTNANGSTTSYTYNGLKTTVTDPLGNKTSKTYSLSGDITEATDALGNNIYYKYDASGNCIEIRGPRTTISVDYDRHGNKQRLTDPDLGTVEYVYNAYGELVEQSDAKGTTTFEYDNLGRIIEECGPDFMDTYQYDSKWKGELTRKYNSSGMLQEYQYDAYGRQKVERQVIEDEQFFTSTTYNSDNAVDVITYPSGLMIRHNYDANGYLVSLDRTDKGDAKQLWRAGLYNACGQPLTETFGNGVSVATQYTLLGAVERTAAAGLFDRQYEYDANNRLVSRTDVMRDMTEQFSYDQLNRLTGTSSNVYPSQSIRYDEAGNIVFKTGVGDVSYSDGTNRISTVSGGTYTLPTWEDVAYTSFNKVSNVKRDLSQPAYVCYDKMLIRYGVDKEKKYQHITQYKRMRLDGNPTANNTRTLQKKYYIGDHYEMTKEGLDTREVNYVYAGGKVVAIVEMLDVNGENTFFAHRDHLGSLMALSNQDGDMHEEFSYDAWGRQRDADTYEYMAHDGNVTNRYSQGFTGHEPIDCFDMVDMQGRIYDPVVGRFLSPDPFVQAPDNTQSLNRYAYCVNNPLSLTDPTGYNWMSDTFAAAVGIAVSLETAGLGAGIYGALISGALGGASSSLMGSLLNGNNLWHTTRSSFSGAFWGAAGGAVNFEIGNIDNVIERIAAHTMAEGAMEGIRGGHVEHGLLMGFASSTGGTLINHYGGNMSGACRVAANATLGGIVSELGSGKFASGAMTAAFTMLFNEMKHRIRFSEINWKIVTKELSRLYSQYNESNNQVLYEKMGGQLWKVCGQYKERLHNACALKLCIALEKAGFTFPYVEGQNLKAANGKSYFVSAGYLYEYMKNNYKQNMQSFENAKELYHGLYNGGMFYQTNSRWTSNGITGHVGAIYRNTIGGPMYKNQITNIGFY